MKKFGKILVALLSVCCMASMASCGVADKLKGADGKDGTNGKSAFELWKEQEGNADKTMDDFLNELIDGKHVYASNTEMIVVENATEGGYGYVKCTDEGCNHAKLVYTNPVGATELSLADEEAKTLNFTSIGTVETFDETWNPIKIKASWAYVSVELGEDEAGEYSLTLSGLSQGGVKINGMSYEMEDNSCTAILELEAGYNEIEIEVGGRISAIPQNVTASISTPTYTPLNIGTNENLAAAAMGTKYEFTAIEAGTYSISWTSDNADIMYITSTGSEAVTNGQAFELAAGESVTFVLCTLNWADDTYTVTIAAASATGSGESAE